MVRGVILHMNGFIFDAEDAHMPQGLYELLEYLHDCAIPIAVASQASWEAMHTRLRRAGIDNYFDVLCSAESLGEPVPDAKLFLEAATLLGTSPRYTILLTNGQDGVKAAKSARFKVVDAQSLGRLDDVIDLIESGALR